MKCTLSIVASLVGPVQPGQMVTIPASLVASHSPTSVAWAKACARQLGVRWHIAAEQ